MERNIKPTCVQLSPLLIIIIKNTLYEWKKKKKNDNRLL